MGETARQFDLEEAEHNFKPVVIEVGKRSAENNALLRTFHDVSSLPSTESKLKYELLTPRRENDTTSLNIQKRIEFISEPILNLCQTTEEYDQAEIEIGEKEILNLLEKFKDPKIPKKGIIDQISEWVKKNPEKRIFLIENFFSETLGSANDIDFYTLTLLAEINPSRELIFVSSKLAEKMEIGERGLSQELKDQIALLNRINDEKANFLLHKILDFMHQYMLTIQDHTEREIEDVGGEYYGGLFEDFWNFANQEIKHSKNYLIKKHFQDITDLREMFDSEKEGAISGFPGGSSDETIYAFSHLYESDKNRRDLGINEGFPMTNPVLPITKGYLGLYKMGQLSEIYKEKDRKPHISSQLEQSYIKKNNLKYEYIYDIINKPLILTGRQSSPSNGLMKLQDFWDFYDRLEADQEKFYFDTTKIDMAKLHPVVVAEILTRNQIYINDENENTKTTPVITNETYKKLLFPLNNYSPEKDYNYNYLMNLAMRKRIEDDFGFKIEEFSMWEQRMFLSFIEQADEKTIQKIKKLISIHGQDVIKTFLSLETDERMVEKIFFLSENLDRKSVDNIFQAYAKIVESAKTSTEEIASEELSEDLIMEGLLVRAKDILKESTQYLSKNKDPNEIKTIVKTTLKKLQQESKKEKIISGLFRKFLELLENKRDGSVDLEQYLPYQQKILEQLQQEGGKVLLLRALSSREELRPLPEIFWKVDRGDEDYQKRFGFSILEFLQKQKKGEEKQVLVEFGQGSGKSKKERAEAGLDEHYLDVGMADKLYYNLRELVRPMINWDELQKQLGKKYTLSDADKDLITDMLYKVIVIADGEVDNENFSYAQERIERITKDPNEIRKILSEIAPKLSTVSTIPDQTDYCEITTEGEKNYPRRSRVAGEDCSPAFLKTKQLLERNMKNLVMTEDQIPDAYELVPAYPAGAIIGDFSGINSLKNRQIDIAVGVRSTVYKEDEDYSNFMQEMFAKLNKDGIYIDDNIRENFGISNRIKQLQEIKKVWETKKWQKKQPEEINIHIIMGPGIEGEDHTENKSGVPMAVVITKKTDHTKVINQLLQPGYYILDIDNYESAMNEVA